jgi:hypothetical protein
LRGVPSGKPGVAFDLHSLSVSLSGEEHVGERNFERVMGICVCEKMTLFMGILVIFTFEASDLFHILFKKKTNMNST